MEKWSGKVAVVTGANYGVGPEVCRTLSENGLTVIGLSSERVKLQIFSTEVNEKIHAIRCNHSDEEEIRYIFKEIVEQFGGVDLLIINAEMSEDIRNLMAFDISAHEALQSMRTRGDDGYIINLNNNTMFKSFTEKLRDDLKKANSKIKICNIDTLKSNISTSNNKTIERIIVDKETNTDLIPSDISELIVSLLSFPSHVEVKEIIMESF